MQTKIAFLLLSIFFLFLLPLYILLSSSNPRSFDDTLGTILAIVICTCFGFAFLLIFIRLCGKSGFNRMAAALAQILFGIGVIVWGCWIFSEKNRFADKPVTKTEAIMTNLGSYTDHKMGYYNISYKYQDVSGQWYNGEDAVDNWIPISPVIFFLHVGDKIPVNYLKANPAVSRLTPNQHFIQVYCIKAFLILVGFVLLLGTSSGNSFTLGRFSFRLFIRPKDRF